MKYSLHEPFAFIFRKYAYDAAGVRVDLSNFHLKPYLLTSLKGFVYD